MLLNSGSNILNASLLPLTSLSGKIKIMDTFTGISGASVSCQGKSSVTDNNGRYLITGLQAGISTITITATGYESQVFNNYPIVEGENIVNVGLNPIAQPPPTTCDQLWQNLQQIQALFYSGYIDQEEYNSAYQTWLTWWQQAGCD